jgi:hypothetical protein
LVTALSILLSGCATIVTGGGESESVRFNSTPRGATVTVDGNMIGYTPCAADLTRKDEHFVEMSYNTETKEFKIEPWPNL